MNNQIKLRESEASILVKIRKQFNAGATRLFRNSIGFYKSEAGHAIKYGLANPGGSDLIGWTSVIITPEMVGKKIAVFTAVEVKAAGGKLRPEQINFLQAVKNAGGLSGMAMNVDEVPPILDIKNLN